MIDAAPGESDPQSDEPAAILLQRDPDRGETLRLAPETQRAALASIYAVDHELAQVAWRVSEPHLAVIRLKYWQDLLTGATQDGVIGEGPPDAVALMGWLAALRPPAALVAQWVDARLEETPPPEGVDALAAAPEPGADAAFLDGTGAALFQLAGWAAVRGRPDPELGAALAQLGRASAAARLLETAAPRLAGGRGGPLIAAMEAPSAGIMRRIAEGETPEPLRSACRAMAARGMSDLQAGRRSVRAARRALDAEASAAVLAVALSTWRADRVFRIAARPTLEVFQDFGPESPFRRRASLAWRAFCGG